MKRIIVFAIKGLIVSVSLLMAFIVIIPTATVFAKAAARSPLELANAYCPIDGNRVNITCPFVKIGKWRLGFCNEECKNRFVARTGLNSY